MSIATARKIGARRGVARSAEGDNEVEPTGRLRQVVVALLLLTMILQLGCATLFQPSVEDLMSDGIALYDAGRYAESVEKFDEVIRRDATRWLAYVFLARSFLALTDWAPAIANATKAFELAPREPQTGQVLAETLLGGGLEALRDRRFSDAIGRLVEYLQLRPQDPQGYLALSRAYFGSGNLSSAGRTLLDGFAAAEGGRPDLLAEMLRVASQALAGGDAQTATQLLAPYVQENPRDLNALLELGKAYWQTGDTGAALDSFQKALRLSPGNREALRYLQRRFAP